MITAFLKWWHFVFKLNGLLSGFWFSFSWQFTLRLTLWIYIWNMHATCWYLIIFLMPLESTSPSYIWCLQCVLTVQKVVKTKKKEVCPTFWLVVCIRRRRLGILFSGHNNVHIDNNVFPFWEKNLKCSGMSRVLTMRRKTESPPVENHCTKKTCCH